MPVPYRPDVLLGPPDLAEPGRLAAINDALTATGLGPALGPPIHTGPDRLVLPVTGADPREIEAAVRRARERGAGLPALTTDTQYRVDTVGGAADVWYASGRRIGHGALGWLAAPAYAMPAYPDPAGGRPPVVAVLDTGVAGHDWLPAAPAERPHWIDATAGHGWQPPVPVPDWRGEMEYGPYFGHGTFLAGIIWSEAPGAQVLSLRVMSDAGDVSTTSVAHALSWLADRADGGEPVDAVLLAFGHRPDRAGGDAGGGADSGADGQVRAALVRLHEHRIPVVASAGNAGSEVAAYPAAYAVDPELTNVTSVGSRISATERAPYSNHGPWVTAWRYGSNVVSLLPQLAPDGRDRYAWWSGTSFAAARYAAELVAAPGREDSGGRTGHVVP